MSAISDSQTDAVPPAILLVDDEPAVLDLMRLVLSRQGYSVSLAETAGRALEELGRRPFDLLVSDAGLPDQPGLRLAEQAREIAPGLPVLMVSGSDVEGFLDASHGQGGVGFLGKPFRPAQLTEAVARMLRAGSG